VNAVLVHPLLSTIMFINKPQLSIHFIDFFIVKCCEFARSLEVLIVSLYTSITSTFYVIVLDVTPVREQVSRESKIL
jgi:hypothetical protein